MGDKNKSEAKKAAYKKSMAAKTKRSQSRWKEGGTALDNQRNAESQNKPKPVYSPEKRRAAIIAKTKSGYYKSKGQTPPSLP